MITPSIPGLNHGPGHVNILNGIMALQIVLPDGGPYSPDPFLTYCSKTALQTEYGYGWQGAHKRQLVVIDRLIKDIHSPQVEWGVRVVFDYRRHRMPDRT